MARNLETRIEFTSLGANPLISNGLVTIAAAPQIGGRVMNLSLGGKKLMYVNPRYSALEEEKSSENQFAGWRNYGGSKVWPAPQGWSRENEWPGPPDPVLDSGFYRFQTFQNDQEAALHLESEPDERSGITLERKISIHPNSSIVHLHHVMRNTSHRRVRWAIWQVTQVDAASGLDIFAPAEGFQQTFGNEPYGGMEYDASAKRIHLRYQNQVAKFAVQANEGWFASLDSSRGVVLVETFPHSPIAQYPDGAPAAFWISGKGTFTLHGDTVDMALSDNGCDPHVETEVMGPITELVPGESTALRTTWRLAAIDAAEILSVNDCGAIGHKLELTGNRLQGSFGVFHVGQLQLVAFDRSSTVVANFDMGQVTPADSVVLNETISLSSSTVRCSLRLIDQNQRWIGTLDHVQIR
jgi:Domain of unknown function (DUF4380)